MAELSKSRARIPGTGITVEEMEEIEEENRQEDPVTSILGPGVPKEELEEEEKEVEGKDYIEAKKIETTGVILEDSDGKYITDGLGHRWAVPDNVNEDLDDLGAGNPFGSLKLDPNFHYQIERATDVPQKITEGLVAVTRGEVGLPPALELEYGKPVSTIVHLLDGVLMKYPKVLAERKQRRKQRIAQEVVEATEPTQEMLDRARQSNALN